MILTHPHTLELIPLLLKATPLTPLNKLGGLWNIDTQSLQKELRAIPFEILRGGAEWKRKINMWCEGSAIKLHGGPNICADGLRKNKIWGRERPKKIWDGGVQRFFLSLSTTGLDHNNIISRKSAASQ